MYSNVHQEQWPACCLPEQTQWAILNLTSSRGEAMGGLEGSAWGVGVGVRVGGPAPGFPALGAAAPSPRPHQVTQGGRGGQGQSRTHLYPRPQRVRALQLCLASAFTHSVWKLAPGASVRHLLKTGTCHPRGQTGTLGATVMPTSSLRLSPFPVIWDAAQNSV